MRRLVVLLAGAACAVTTFSAPAWATPTVKFKAEFVPIPGFAHTGNLKGAGAAIHEEYQIEGTEYGGFPPPIVGVNFYLPSGTTLHTTGFPTCAKSVLEQTGPTGCPKSSEAGPIGSELGIVSFGSERVEESATLQSFYAPGGGLEFFTNGYSPVSLEILWASHYVNLGGGGGFGPELITEVPLVSTVPGAPYESLRSINSKTGSAYKSGAKTIYYDQVPTKCPTGGFPIKTEVIFDEGGANPPVPEPVTATYKAPCPRGSGGGGGGGGEPAVKKVQFKGSVSDPEIVIKGKNLGSEPPSPTYPPGPCPERGTGNLFGESLELSDDTGGWTAGNGGPDGLGACIGLEVTSWSKSKVTLKFGNDYNIETTPQWQLQPGDEYTLSLFETETTGTVLYKGKAKS